jgi:hypothetical protein
MKETEIKEIKKQKKRDLGRTSQAQLGRPAQQRSA